MNIEDIVWIWGENGNPNPPGGPPGVGFGLWPHLFGQEWQRFTIDPRKTGQLREQYESIQRAKVAIVNLFHVEGSPVEAVKGINPSCYVIVCPDSSLDQVLNHPEWIEMHRQMSLADAIGGRTMEDCRVYGTLLDKLTFHLPCPIGPTEFFLPFRDIPKGDHILGLDHRFAPPNTYGEVAALAAIQRKTGAHVVYACEWDWTREYAKLAGLKAEFLGDVPFQQFVALTAEARLCVDMYASHSVGRHQMLCAMVGTPCISNNLSTPVVGAAILADLYHPHDACVAAETYLNDPVKYQAIRMAGYRYVEKRSSFETSRQRIATILEQINEHPVRGSG